MNLNRFARRTRVVRAADATVLALGMSLAACAVGPDFKVPPVPAVADPSRPYTAAPLPEQTASAPGASGAPQRFVAGQDIPALWWGVFQSEPLNQLIRTAVAQSPSLGAAQAALRQAQELYTADAGSKLLPSVSGQLGAERERASQVTTGIPGGSVFNVYSALINASYTVDAFGGTRRELEGLQAAIDYQRYQLEAAYLTLTSNLVTTAIQEMSLRAQLQATRDVVDAEAKGVSLVQTQARIGAIARSVVLAQQAQLAQTQATIPALEKALAQTRQQLAVYAGRLPSDSGVPEFNLDSLQLPADLPVSLPSELLRQRPDVRAAEALLHEASTQIGVATANLYPQITLSGSVGAQSFKLNQLFNQSNLVWSLASGLTQPIFNGGALQARKRAAIAAFDQAGAQYQQTVLGAFLSVANALRALDSDADALRTQADAESLARQSFDLVARQYRLGATSYLALLDAQRTFQQTKIGLVQAQSARLTDTAVLFQALGGGWWNRAELADVTKPSGGSDDAKQ